MGIEPTPVTPARIELDVLSTSRLRQEVMTATTICVYLNSRIPSALGRPSGNLVGEARGLITINKTITDIALPRIAMYRIEQNQTIPTIIDNIGYGISAHVLLHLLLPNNDAPSLLK